MFAQGTGPAVTIELALPVEERRGSKNPYYWATVAVLGFTFGGAVGWP